MRPFESASEVVSRPIRNAWRGITRYDDLDAENQRLREQVDAQQANDIQNQASLSELYELRTYYELDTLGDHPRVLASVIGQTPTNIDQVIEIDKGRNDGLREGMAVIATNGLVGKITRADADRAWVMLITDARYGVEVEVVAPEPTTTTTVVTTTTVPSTVPGATAAADHEHHEHHRRSHDARSPARRPPSRPRPRCRTRIVRPAWSSGAVPTSCPK